MLRHLLLFVVIAAVLATSQHHQHSGKHTHHNHDATPAKPVSMTLNMHSMPDDRRATVLFSLKMRQLHLGTSLLETRAVPLAQEVLQEKHLATYYGNVMVGDTAFKILFDTGSSEFWIPSSECKADRCMKHQQYPFTEEDYEKVDPDAQLDIEYLSGKVLGKMIYEKLILGDLEVPRQELGIASTIDITLLDDVIWDGILGLAFPNPDLVTAGVVPLFDTLINEELLTRKGLSNQFAYYIDDEKGSMTFGGADCSLIVPPDAPAEECISKFHFVPITDQTYWTVTLRDVLYQYPGAEKIGGNCPPEGCQAIVDTGTYLLYGPAGQVDRMISDTLNSCADYSTMPEITFEFFVGEGEEPLQLTLRPIDYILKFEMDDQEDCVVGISPDQDTIWTLGQVFLRSFYTLFDRDMVRVGFARIERDDFDAIGDDEDDHQEAEPVSNNESFIQHSVDMGAVGGAEMQDEVTQQERRRGRVGRPGPSRRHNNNNRNYNAMNDPDETRANAAFLKELEAEERALYN